MKQLSISSRAFGLASLLMLAGAPLIPLASLQAQDTYSDDQQTVRYTPDQLDNLLAPIALYSDPLLAQVLLAATFPDQVQDAARFVRANGTSAVDNQSWDVSVKAVAHYMTVLNMMDTKIDWTTSLGQAYAAQSSDVMQSVQRLRAMANSQGNLVTTTQQQVVDEDGAIAIWPAQPQVIYVPVYDPTIIYFRPVVYGGRYGSYISFGYGYPIGSWLIYDWNWGYGGGIVYTGWNRGGWVARSRPYVRINTVYVDNRYRTVGYNHHVFDHHVDYTNILVYNSIHRDTRWDNVSHRVSPAPSPLDRVGARSVVDHKAPQQQGSKDAHGRTVPVDHSPPVHAAPAGSATTTHSPSHDPPHDQSRSGQPQHDATPGHRGSQPPSSEVKRAPNTPAAESFGSKPTESHSAPPKTSGSSGSSGSKQPARSQPAPSHSSPPAKSAPSKSAPAATRVSPSGHGSGK